MLNLSKSVILTLGSGSRPRKLILALGLGMGFQTLGLLGLGSKDPAITVLLSPSKISYMGN